MTIIEKKSLFEMDEHLWTEGQIEALRSRDFSRVDADLVADVLQEMTGSDRYQLMSRLDVLIMHMLKLKMQPQNYSNSWFSTMREQNKQLRRLLKRVPSLKRFVAPYIEEVYPDAVEDAAVETGIPAAYFPKVCPWTPEEILSFTPPPIVNKP